MSVIFIDFLWFPVIFFDLNYFYPVTLHHSGPQLETAKEQILKNKEKYKKNMKKYKKNIRKYKKKLKKYKKHIRK